MKEIRIACQKKQISGRKEGKERERKRKEREIRREEDGTSLVNQLREV